MQPLLRLGSAGLLLLMSFAAPAARADQPLDEPAPFGVIQFSPDEAWIDLPWALGDTWSATLAVLAELKYAVALDAPYIATNGHVRIADLWVAVEPHGSRDKFFTRIRIALDKHDDEYSQVRAEVILDAVATRLAPPAPPEPAPATTPYVSYATQPVDPGVQNVYTGVPVTSDAYAYSTPGTTVYNTYNYNTYDDTDDSYGYGGYGGYSYYPMPYYSNYGCYSSFGNYFPYWSCWNKCGYGSWYGGYWTSPYNNSWAMGPTFTYWNSPTWGYGYGCNSWWNFGFSGCWGNYCATFGYPWSSCGGWGNCSSWDSCGNDLVVCDTPTFGDDVVDGGSSGKGGIGKSPNAGGLHAKGSAKPVATGKPVLGTPGTGVPAGDTAADDGTGTGMTAGPSLDGTPLADADEDLPVGDPNETPGRRNPRDGGFPRIQVTHRERNEAGARFDPRTTVTRTVDTRTVDSRGDGTRGSSGDDDATRNTTGARRTNAYSTTGSLPHMTDSASTSSRGSAQPGRVVRLNSAPYRPGFVGVMPGASRPVDTVGGTSSSGSSDGGDVSHGSGNPYAGTPTPVANHPPTPSAPAPVFNGPGTISFQPPAVRAPSGNPYGNGPGSAPPPVAAPRVSAPSPSSSQGSRPPAVTAPSFGGSSGHGSSPSLGGSPSVGGGSGRSGGSSGGSSAGHGGGSSGGSSAGKGGGRGRP